MAKSSQASPIVILVLFAIAVGGIAIGGWPGFGLFCLMLYLIIQYGVKKARQQAMEQEMQRRGQTAHRPGGVG